jgi:HK97 family phage prohead protease
MLETSMDLNCPALAVGFGAFSGRTKAAWPDAIFARETKFIGEPPSVVTDAGEFEGYASLFDEPDLGKDVVVRGAFSASLARRGVGGVRMLWQHDPSEPVGRWLSLVEDARGLKVRGRLNLAVARAREIRSLLKDGGIDGLSIGFRVERARKDKATGLRRLEKLDLWEISLVTFPMLPAARVGAVKRRGGGPLGSAEAALARKIRRAASRLFG